MSAPHSYTGYPADCRPKPGDMVSVYFEGAIKGPLMGEVLHYQPGEYWVIKSSNGEINYVQTYQYIVMTGRSTTSQEG